ncbi:MAG: class 1 fructose-bisphosphatase [Planctomycetes bacterium]|nr:class 1 fructose-bisphosphatase [Planctomycetota bacterium]
MATFSSKIVTIERHTLQQQQFRPGATGALTQLLNDIAASSKIISREVRRAGLGDILGEEGSVNVSGDEVKKLDVYADKAIYRMNDHTGRVCVMASEEQEEIIPIPDKFASEQAKYVLMFDPLDGSSNIDCNASIGTIFSIHLRQSEGAHGTLEDCLQPGSRQVAAGYVIYGSSTVMVYTTGHGVHGFTLDSTLGEFLLSHENIKIPDAGKIYSINERDTHSWTENLQRYIAWLKVDDASTRRPRSSRYIGSMISDVHRTLIKGGIFMYPGTVKKSDGKLRLQYEVNPLAFVVEQAGGQAITEDGQRVLDLQPTELHQRTPIFMGSKGDVDECASFLDGSHSALA